MNAEKSPAPEELPPFVEGGNAAALPAGEGASPNGERGSSLDGTGSDGIADIQITTDEHLANEAAANAIATDPCVYQRLGQLVHVVCAEGRKKDAIQRPPNAPRIADLPAALVRESLCRSARFWKYVKREDSWVRAHPPEYTVAAVHQRRSWPGVRPLEGILEIPAMRANGSIIQRPGYDEVTGLFYAPGADFSEVPELPTQEDAVRARNEICEAVRDFPFAGPSHWSAFVAALLTAFARPAFEGPVPLTLIDANAPGSGKGLLADVIAILQTGRVAARTPYSSSDEETRKVITSVALAGDSLVLFDNVVGQFGGASLEAVMTGAMWQDRTLGKNERLVCELRTQFFATGNNIVLTSDILRRVLHIRLESACENPEERTDFVHGDLLPWIRSERVRLVRAALTILRAYHVAGRPSMNLPGWGSFEGWDRLVRHAVVWTGLDDPNAHKRELRSASDQGLQEVRLLIAALEEVDPEHRGITAVDMARRYVERGAGKCPALSTAIETLGLEQKGSLAKNLGYRLRRHKGRIVAGKRIGSPATTREAVTLWAAES